MLKTNRFFLLLLPVAFIMLSTLTGCGSKSADTANNTPTVPAK